MFDTFQGFSGYIHIECVCLDKDEILKEVKERVFNSKQFVGVTAFFVSSQDLRQCKAELHVRKRDSKLIRFVVYLTTLFQFLKGLSH
jgi:hypothetical protein